VEQFTANSCECEFNVNSADVSQDSADLRSEVHAAHDAATFLMDGVHTIYCQWFLYYTSLFTADERVKSRAWCSSCRRRGACIRLSTDYRQIHSI